MVRSFYCRPVRTIVRSFHCCPVRKIVKIHIKEKARVPKEKAKKADRRLPPKDICPTINWPNGHLVRWSLDKNIYVR